MFLALFSLITCCLVVVYLETYGCQMNVNDTDVAWAILQKNGYLRTKSLEEVGLLPSSCAGVVTRAV